MVLSGRYEVKRVSGFLPPFGVSKTIVGDEGCTYLFGVPIGRFRVEGRRFVYRRWPIVDELAPEHDEDDDSASPKSSRMGTGLLWGKLRFCRFRLEPISSPPA